MPKVQAVCSVSQAVFAVSIRVPSVWMEFLHPICSQVLVLWLVPHSGAGGTRAVSAVLTSFPGAVLCHPPHMYDSGIQC